MKKSQQLMNIYTSKHLVKVRDNKASTMNCMNSNRMNILDLPDEILCIIVNKLSMVDVFYSLVDVNQRLNRLAFDHVYIHHHVDFVVRPSRTHFPSSPSDPILEQICSNVLPRINSDVYQLTVEPCSAEDVLGIVDYPHLYYLSLINFPAETLLPQLTGEWRNPSMKCMNHFDILIFQVILDLFVF